MAALLVSLLALATWVYLIAFRGGYWRLREHDRLLPLPGGPSAEGVRVTAIMPARDDFRQRAGRASSPA